MAKGRSSQEPGALDPPVSHTTISIRLMSSWLSRCGSPSFIYDWSSAHRECRYCPSTFKIPRALTNFPELEQNHNRGVSCNKEWMKRLDWLALKSVFACYAQTMEMMQMQERGLLKIISLPWWESMAMELLMMANRMVMNNMSIVWQRGQVRPQGGRSCRQPEDSRNFSKEVQSYFLHNHTFLRCRK